MDDGGEIREDIKLPESDLGKDIQAKHDAGSGDILITVLKAMGEEVATATKAMAKWKNGLGENILLTCEAMFVFTSSIVFRVLSMYIMASECGLSLFNAHLFRLIHY